MIDRYLMSREAWEQMSEDQKAINEIQEKHKLIEFLEWMRENGLEVCQFKEIGGHYAWLMVHDMCINMKFTDIVDRYFHDTGRGSKEEGSGAD